MTLSVIVEADGGARGNPGPAGYGALVREAPTGQVLIERAEAIGVATNNVAEYRGLIAGLQAAADLAATDVIVRMDSKLVIEQMAGRWQIKHPGLRPLAAKAAALVGRFSSVTWEWIPRERNRAADALANAAMDEAAAKARAEGGGRGGAPASSGGVPASRAGGGGGGAASAWPAAPPSRGGGEAAAGRERAAGAASRSAPSWAPPSADPLRMLLVRHGATELTAQGRYSGRGDVPLSTAGRAQAEAAGVRVAALLPELTAVVTSPLARCVATAKVIAGGAPVVVEPDLIECDFGAWEGLTFAEVRERWPAEMDAWLGGTSVPPPGGETFQAVAKRARRAVARLREAYPRGGVVVVSHVTPIKLILRDALAAGDQFLYRLYLDPAGISTVDFWPDGNLAVRVVNDTAHLPG